MAASPATRVLMKYLHFEDVEVGDHWTSPSRTILESDILGFAGLTGDFDPLHVDHVYARESPFGRPIAHGLFGLSLVAGLASQCPAIRTLAFVSITEWQFRNPMYVGDTVHAVTRVEEKRPHGRKSGMVTWRRELVNQEGAIVQMGNFTTLVALARAGERKSKATGAKSA
ncbi:MAG TPA: dehydratase [Planctomycetes bacterium]|nr:dehydratase [Planctomycetaceae bacterium]HIM28745.1 dehydratase [Planctomycetota bacterium]